MNAHKRRIYLDYAATTPLDEEALHVMLPYFTEKFGNSSSVHFWGQQAETALTQARETLAQGLNCLPSEVIFTSCGSESDNLALRGVALAARQSRQANHILISPVEHHAVSRTAEQLHHVYGFELEYLPVDQLGVVHPDDVASRIRPTTAMVSVIYANNEIGTINPIAEIGKVCRERSVPFHTDAVQATSFLLLDVQALNVDLLSLGAHKFYGPKGVGALFIRKGVLLFPHLTGGGQEFGLRAGTHNIPYIVGMVKAFQLAQIRRDELSTRLSHLRDRIIRQILNEVPDALLTGHPIQRLPNHASFVFRGVDGNSLLMALDLEGFACSSGSACKTGNPEPSEVLIALGLRREWALGSLRITLGKTTTEEEVEHFLSRLPSIVIKQRSLVSSEK